MKRNRKRGSAIIEFALSLLVLMPLFLGTGAIGINLNRTLQTVQLARDAGHMFARGVDFSDPGNQKILATIGTGLGLSATAGQGTAEVIFSALTYVDGNTCTAANQLNGNGNAPTCTNLGQWVFTQRLEIGNTGLRGSNYGSPLTSGPTGVTLDSQGKISLGQYATRAGAVAQFSSANGINPYAVVNGVASGLPSGQKLYLSEAASQGFGMPPYVQGSPTYSFSFF
ncbi:MAG TPA: TadE family protein [Bryobacteraceae bacterium]|jgi:hypothetical protein|nr:TadE family protein [Bryobacteraceae bacterium]